MKRVVVFVLAACLLMPGVLLNMNLDVDAEEYEAMEPENEEDPLSDEMEKEEGTEAPENIKGEAENEREEEIIEDKQQENGATQESSDGDNEVKMSTIQKAESADLSMGTTLTLTGEGTSENPYQITTAEQLEGFAQDVNSGNDYEGKYVVLENDIYLNEIDQYENWDQKAPESQWTPIMNFSGNFDGKQHTIHGMYINSTSDYAGMFGRIDSETF